MEAHSTKDGDSIIEILETRLHDGLKVLKKLVDTIEKFESISLKENAEELGMNKDEISHIKKDIAHLCQLITLSRSEYANLHAANVNLVEEIDLLKNAIGRCALISIVSRDIQDIESEVKLKQNKIVDSVARIEKNTNAQVEKIFHELNQLRGEVRKMDVSECRILKIEERLEKLASDIIQTDEDMMWMKDLHEELSCKIEDVLVIKG